MTSTPSEAFEDVRDSLDQQFCREDIDRFRQALADYAVRRKQEIDTEKKSIRAEVTQASQLKSERMASLDDDETFLPVLMDLVDELSILALHKKVEISYKRILTNHFDALDSTTLFDVRNLLSSVKIDLEKITGWYGIDELRLLANAIKHDGCVTKELRNYGFWEVGKKIEGLDQRYEALASEVERFFFSMVGDIKKFKQKEANRNRKAKSS